jgi:hypothetical protein
VSSSAIAKWLHLSGSRHFSACLPPFVLDTPLARARIHLHSQERIPKSDPTMSSDDPKHVSALCAEVDLEQSSVVWIAIPRPRLLTRLHFTQSRVSYSSDGGSFLCCRQIPDEALSSILNRSGCRMEADPRLVRVLNLAVQRFVSQIAYDALQHSHSHASNSNATKNTKVRSHFSCISSWPLGGLLIARVFPSVAPILQDGAPAVTLTMDDLLESLRDQGVHLSKPGYHVGPADADGKS